MEDMIGWLMGAAGAAGATVVAWARGFRGRRAIARLLTGAVDLDEQTSKAVSVSIAALQAALDNAMKDHRKIGMEVADLREEMAELREKNLAYVLEIDKLKVEVAGLRAENLALRQRLAEMGS